MTNTMVTYVHYGTKTYYPELFIPVRNSRVHPYKPDGGFWGSRENDPHSYGWKEYNQFGQYAACYEDNCVRFVLKDGANILFVRSAEDMKYLPMVDITDADPNDWRTWGNYRMVDYERIAKDFDAVELLLDKEHGLSYFGAWDCDSIVVLNKDAVVQI